MNDHRKYIYCIVREGFNDNLCQMEKAWRFAERSGRILIVNSQYGGMGDRWDKYFSTVDKRVVLHPSEGLLKYFDEVDDVYPHCLKGRVSSHAVICSSAHNFQYLDQVTQTSLRLDFNKEYKEKLVVHHSSGGGELSINCLARLRLRDELIELLSDALSPLEGDYLAIHVRNTDYKTEYMSFFKKIFSEVAGHRLLICSDDWTCREVAKKFFVESSVVTVSDIPDTKGRPLHNSASYVAKGHQHFEHKPDFYESNCAMLIDLLALAKAKKFFTPQLAHIPFSGFSRLAENLHKHPKVIDKLLGNTESL